MVKRTRLGRLVAFVRAPWRHLASDRGAILVLAAFGLAGFMSLVALTVDIGRVFHERRDMQNAADAAAHAGALSLLEGRTNSEAVAVANSYSEQNAPDAAATIQIPPTSGAYASDPECARVETRETVTDFFAPIGDKDVAATATACTIWIPTPYAIIVLDPTACKAMSLDSNARITVSGAGTFNNSECDSSALYMNSNAIVTTNGNDLVGGASVNGVAEISPEPKHSYHITDPLAGLPVPLAPTNPARTCPTMNGGGSTTLQPGLYPCLLTARSNHRLTFQPGNYSITGGIKLDQNVDVTFGAGVYTIGGVGLQVSSNVTLTANSVTFYIASGCVTIDSNGWININAPGSGTYAGVAIFQSRSNTCELHMDSNAGIIGWGTIYAPAATVEFNSDAGATLQIIANRLHMDSNATIDMTFDNNFLLDRPWVKLVE